MPLWRAQDVRQPARGRQVAPRNAVNEGRLRAADRVVEGGQFQHGLATILGAGPRAGAQREQGQQSHAKEQCPAGLRVLRRLVFYHEEQVGRDGTNASQRFVRFLSGLLGLLVTRGKPKFRGARAYLQ